MKNMLFVCLLLLTKTTMFGQTSSTKQSIFDLMNYQEVLSVTLKADFAKIDTTRRSNEKFKAEFSFESATGELQTWNVKLTNRGHFRRLRCEMSPLKINFSKKALKAAGLAKYDDMKLVTHCVSSKSEAKALIQKEYLAYKLYNELTEFSYRVQLLKINYVDVHTGKKTKHWAFLIEDSAELRNRVNATANVENALNLPRDTFHDGILKIASVFQYFIGNADWDINVARNLKYLVKDEKVIVVPYDFDFSGLVNAPYAVPNPNYGIPTVKTRIYLGFKEDVKQIKGTLSYYKTKQASLFKIVDDYRVMDTTKREEILHYLASFYNTMNEIVVGERVLATTELETAEVKE